ncbi:WD repeat-containing protein [Plasmodium brasilianum]|uniref:WD repeat-containing protein, putative n=2 Tax=Plasmodium (Plasmodium) TaxID=418103 RepID=A0A1D3TD62_PLAMA|nr:WD repeat-containing protein, putative [Plasmodium malariae]KAI4835911.1 WD repeat-containing protein [Plasmodium brasilianum]SCP02848.1 WD repeat-containing protein, putative [Plasmodium malariae]
MKKRRIGNSDNSSRALENLSIGEENKKYIYPSIANSPILLCNDKIIYGYGNSLIVFCLKENKYIKKIQDHRNAIRSLDVNENNKYFLTTGDDKLIIIYDENWTVCHRIIHKKKIVKAYFLKYVQREEKKFEILFVDKYGDMYIYDINTLIRKEDEPTDSATVEGNEKRSAKNGHLRIEKSKEDDQKEEKTEEDDKGTVKLRYLNDALNEIQENDDDLFFMKDFEHMLQNNSECSENSLLSDKSNNKQEDNTEGEMVDDYANHELLNLKDKNKMNNVKKKLERHYLKCLQNKCLLYPIMTCNSAVISLYYDKNFLIIGDRDEKIRIIKNKSINKIYNFYLNHKLFITSLLLINEHTFCSAAADCYLHLWDIKTKEIVDSLYLDFHFLSKFIELKLIFNNSNHMNKYKFIVSILNYHHTASSIFATIENLKGILIIPLIMDSKTNSNIKFNKENISFYPLKYDVLSFLFLNVYNTYVVFFTDRNKGTLHQIKLNEHGQLGGELITYDHSFFDGKEKMDIGLINYWKHTTIEGDSY